MNNVFKKVLIYLGVGALGAMLGIGALIGVSSCAYKQDSNTQQKAKAQPKKRLITFSESDLDNDNKYYFVAKNYDNDGASYFWQKLGPSHTIENATYSSGKIFDGYFASALNSTFNFTMLSPLTDYEVNHLRFSFVQYGGHDILDSVIYYTSDYSGGWGLFSLSNTDGQSYFNRHLASFLATNINVGYTFVIDLVNALFNVYKLDNQVYTMSSQINYYMPYTQNIDTGVVFDNSVLSSDWVKRYTLIEGKPFYSNGLVFDTIKLVYRNAYNKVFNIYDDVKKLITDSTGIAYYSEMVYENSVTGLSKVVNNRDYVAASDNNNLVMLYQRSSSWINTSYRVLKFFDTPNTSQFEALDHLNNLSYGSDWYANNNVSTDVGLGGVFNLLSLAFSSWASIFSIQIIPGITIGLLMFLPLIAGVIILIIWVVKR